MTVFARTKEDSLKRDPLVKVAEQLRRVLAVTSKSDPAYMSIEEALTNVWEAIDASDQRYMATIKAAIERNAKRKAKADNVTQLKTPTRDRKPAGALV
jgi:hypothetical protein